jgi:hypothetical protein
MVISQLVNSSIFLNRSNYFFKIFLVAFFSIISSVNAFSQSFAINLGGQELQMIDANRSLVTNAGNNGLSAGSVWRYDNMITANGITVYGKLTIVNMNNASISSVAYLDDETAGTGAPFRFQPRITTGTGGGYISFKLEFFELVTNQNVYISNYYLTGVDIDGQEFYEISGYSSYVTDATCVLGITPSTIQTPGTRFAALNNGELNGITFDNTRAFIAKFPHPATVMYFVMGASGAYTDRQFSAQFGSMGGTFSTIETQYNPNPVLTISKTASPAIFSPGSNSQYTINVTNSGNTVAGVTVTDVLPSELSYIPNSTSVFIPASTTSKTVRDEFTTTPVTYTEQDGVGGIWNTNWLDNDNNASSGTIYISGGKLTFANLIVSDAIERTVNLLPAGSTSGSAVLTFDYTLTGNLGTSSLTVQLSTDGTNYTNAGTLTGSNSSGTFTYTLPTGLLSSNTRLRFANMGVAWASSSKIISIDNVQIAYSYSKPDVTRTNAPGTLTDGNPSGYLVAAADAVTLEPGVKMAITFNVSVECSATGTKTNTATATCTGLSTPVSASHVAKVGPVSNGDILFCTAGTVNFTASGAASGQVYRWYSGPTGGSVLYTGNPYSPSISATTTFYVSLYNTSSGCESARIPITATYAQLSGTATISELTSKAGGTSYYDTQSSVGFSVSGITGATTYSWTTTTGATFVGGTTTGTTIYLNFNNNAISGNVCVTPSNSCGVGTQKCLSITISNPSNYGISGHLYFDADGSAGASGTSAKVDGTGIGTIGGQQIYAVLFDKQMTIPSGTGGVVTSQAIANDGSFSFLGLKSTSNNYHIYISKSIFGTGTPLASLVSSLPAGAVFNGAIDNNTANTLTGGSTTNGYLQNITAADPVNSNVNFGVLLTNPTAVNDGPIPVDEDHSVSFNVTTNDVAVSGHPITVSTVDLDPLTSGRQTSYTVSGQGTFTVNNLGVVTFVPLADFYGTVNTTYTVEADANVISNIAGITVVVNPVNDAPSFVKGANQYSCAGSLAQTVNSWASAIHSGPSNESLQTFSFTIAGNTNSSIFSVQPSISSDGSLTYTPHATNYGTATITVNLQDNGGTLNGGVDTSGSQTFTITVNGNSTLTQTSSASTNPQTVCINSAITPVTFSVGGTGIGASVTAGSLPSGVSGTYNSGVFIISGTPTVAGTFSYTITTSGGSCSQTSVSGTLIVQSVVATATIGGTTSVCINSTNPSVTFTGSGGTSPYTFFYKVNGGSVQSVTTSSGSSVSVTQPSNVAGSFVYSLVSIGDASSAICSRAQSGTATITVNSLPTITGTTSVCVGSTTQLTGSGTAASSNPWISSLTSVATVNSTGLVTGVVAGSATITYTNSNGCIRQVSVTVNGLPTITLAGSTASVCYSSSSQVTTLAYSATTNAPTSYSISWNSSPTNSFAVVTDVALGSSPISITVPANTTAGTYTGYLTMKNGNGCVSGVSSFTLIVNSLPSATYISTPVSCFGGSDGKIDVTGIGGSGSYYFSIDNGLNYTNTYETKHTFLSLIAKNYIIVVKDANGCISIP